MQSMMTVVKLAMLIASLWCIAAGLWGRNAKTLTPIGVMGLITVALYFLGGRAPLWVVLPAVCVGFAAVIAWLARLHREEDARLPVRSQGMGSHRLALMFVGDVVIMSIAIVATRDPVPVLIVFGLICIGSFFLIRTVPPQQH